MKLYKVLVDGNSCHGGHLAWSLPKDGRPGEWHRVEGTLEICRHGLHLTDDPAHWWAPNCAIYEAEAEEVRGEPDSTRKVVCRGARLLREVTDAAELAALRIYVAGSHTAPKDLPCVVLGSASVTASGSASVTASGSASVRASGSASVRASGSASVRAYDSASVRASGSASVRAYGSASVTAYDSASVTAYDSASVTASGSASVTASGSASVTASGSASVRAYGSASVTAYDSASVRASGSASVRASGSASVTAEGAVTVVSWWGKPGVKISGRAVWVERGENTKAPKVHTAKRSKKARKP